MVSRSARAAGAAEGPADDRAAADAAPAAAATPPAEGMAAADAAPAAAGTPAPPGPGRWRWIAAEGRHERLTGEG